MGGREVRREGEGGREGEGEKRIGREEGGWEVEKGREEGGRMKGKEERGREEGRGSEWALTDDMSMTFDYHVDKVWASVFT